mmetsp:Transcript_17938/g.41837  ORF Transcript_17938/g.41837 Transcript_17938/m.41837 type:complete len:356 (-) Transcript_17938:227-1294(-)|eukprot:CAMPEP_0178430974 /NCGR_PEP_ID=MMETSP0689_2-20121128/31597_1 /TAXON_ID=160604 /ORGANISM="Amphidinium massartii, Strain CS-259" /LENGTH=355 /DNA_ID=CAMNT_0020052849 /DNA_START=43 /DNA_END=1110 /DNA_ORIENTATION=-
MTTVTPLQVGACKFCKGTDTILDEVSGDNICTSCGMVLEERCMDMGVEWRSFKIEGVQSGQRVESRQRGGEAGDEDEDLFEETAAEGTFMDGSDSMAKRLQAAHRAASQRAATPASAEDRFMRNAVSKVREIAKLLNLSDVIVSRCKALLKTIGGKKIAGGGRAPVLNEQTMFSIVYLACREERAGRTIKEIVHTANPDRKNIEGMEKGVEKRIVQLKKELGSELVHSHQSYVPPEDLMNRFTSRVSLSQEVCRVATAVAQEIYKRPKLIAALKAATGKGSSENAIVAATIFAVAWLLKIEHKPSFAQVAVVAKVPESHVRAVYRAFRPEVAQILPAEHRSRLMAGVNSLPAAES